MCKEAFVCGELIEGTLLYHLAVLNAVYSVAFFHSAKTVGDYDRGTFDHYVFQGTLNFALRFFV